jgi:hypothetical protein
MLRYISKATFINRAQQLALNSAKLLETKNKLSKQLQGRLFLKRGMKYANIYEAEGQYYCVVSNIRGGSIEIARRTNIVTVTVGSPEPSVIKMRPNYTPRSKVMRRHWVRCCFSFYRINFYFIFRGFISQF